MPEEKNDEKKLKLEHLERQFKLTAPERPGFHAEHSGHPIESPEPTNATKPLTFEHKPISLGVSEGAAALRPEPKEDEKEEEKEDKKPEEEKKGEPEKDKPEEVKPEEKKPEEKKEEPKPPVPPVADKPLVLDEDKPKPVDKAKQNEEFKKALEEIKNQKPPAPIIIGNKPTPIQIVFEGIFRVGLAGVLLVMWRYALVAPEKIKDVLASNELTASLPSIDTIIEYTAYFSIVLAVMVLIGWQKRFFLAIAGIFLFTLAIIFGYPVIF